MPGYDRIFDMLERLRQMLPGPKDVFKGWIDMTGQKTVPRAGSDAPFVSGFTQPENPQDKAIDFTKQYNVQDGVIMAGASDGSLRVAPDSEERRKTLKRAGYLQNETMQVPSLLHHQRFENEEIQKQFESL